MIVEIEHFMSFRNASEIKFLYVIGPFSIKRKDAFPMVEIFLKQMNFETTNVVNYDPYHIISIRGQVNKNKPFEHQEV